MNGFSITNPSQTTCLNNGAWSNAPPICENYMTSDCDAGSLKSVFKNGFINCNQNEKSQLTCRFSCFTGFILTGSPIIYCQSNNKFNTLPPNCVPISPNENANNFIELDHASITSPNLAYSNSLNYFVTPNSIQCSQMNRLKNGSTNCDCQTGNIQIGCVCRFFCNEDHFLIGSPMIACTKSGNWSSASPFCRRKFLNFLILD